MAGTTAESLQLAARERNDALASHTRYNHKVKQTLRLVLGRVNVCILNSYEFSRNLPNSVTNTPRTPSIGDQSWIRATNARDPRCEDQRLFFAIILGIWNGPTLPLPTIHCSSLVEGSIVNAVEGIVKFLRCRLIPNG